MERHITLRNELLAALAFGPRFPDDLLRKVTGTAHADRIGAALRELETQGLVRFGIDGYRLVGVPSVQPLSHHNLSWR